MFLNLIKPIILLGGKMRIPYKTRLLLAIGICTVVFIAGCVDTSVNPIPNSIDYSSQMKVVNLVSGAGTATLTLNGQSLGAVPFGTEFPATGSAFATIPAGNKTLSATFASAGPQTYKFAAATDYKFRLFLIGDATSSEAYATYERYIFQTKDSPSGKALFPADTGWVAIVNGSPDAVLNSVTINGTKTTFTGGLAKGDAYPYIKLAAGDYTFDVTYNDTESTSFTYTVASQGRYTAVVWDVSASIKNAVFIDD
jgi:hypothetical protein